MKPVLTIGTKEAQSMQLTEVNAEPICSICNTPLEPSISEPGIWRCEYVFDTAQKEWNPKLVPNK